MNETSYNKLEKSLKKLKERYHYLLSLKETSLPKDIEKQAIESAKESVIKRFEICYDGLWKSLNKYLEEAGFKNLPFITPKKIFRKVHETGLINKEILKRLFVYIQLRMDISHEYSEDKAEEILKETLNFIQDIEGILQAIRKEKAEWKKADMEIKNYGKRKSYRPR